MGLLSLGWNCGHKFNLPGLELMRSQLASSNIRVWDYYHFRLIFLPLTLIFSTSELQVCFGSRVETSLATRYNQSGLLMPAI